MISCRSNADGLMYADGRGVSEDSVAAHSPYPLQDFRLAMLSAKAVLLVIGWLYERDFPCECHLIATFCGVAVGRRASRQVHDCDKGLS